MAAVLEEPELLVDQDVVKVDARLYVWITSIAIENVRVFGLPRACWGTLFVVGTALADEKPIEHCVVTDRPLPLASPLTRQPSWPGWRTAVRSRTGGLLITRPVPWFS